MLDLFGLGEIQTIIVLVFGAVVAIWGAIWRAEKRGAANERNKRNADELKALDKGRAAVRDGRSSGKSNNQRVRDNDGLW
jgi:hypothetical protein